MQKRLHAVIHGRVQGVSFRYYTVSAAQQLGLTGWVRNRPDGTVETMAEGQQHQLNRFIDFLHNGSPAADVAQVTIGFDDATGEFNNFGVR